MVLFTLAPVLCWLALFILLYTTVDATGIFTKLRIAFLFSTVLHGLLFVLITEGLSAYSTLSFRYVLLSWLLILLVLLGACLYKRIRLTKIREILIATVSIYRLGWMVWIMAICVLVSFILAIAYPPNNYDSMTYHMARVAHWVQNKNIAYYQTHILRQLELQPFAEWVILHFQVLAGRDILANSVQLFYFIGCITTISLITKELGGSAQQQLATAFYTCLIPMAIIQSNTTQNDIAVAFFIIAFVYCTILLLRRVTGILLLIAGASLGLALLTKGTAYIFALPFCGWYLLGLIKEYRQPFKKVLGNAFLFALVPAIAILINSGYFYRNTFLTGSPLGTTYESTGNGGTAIKPITFVAIKNLMTHLPVTRKMKDGLTAGAAEMGVDIDDPRYSFVPTYWMHEGIYYHEDYMQNYIHLLLILLASILFLFKKNLYNSRISYYTLFVATLMATALLYCVLLKWQPWTNRLQTGLFMLYCVLLSMEIGRFNKWIQLVSYIPVLYFSYNALFKSNNHPFPYNKQVYHSQLDNSLIPNVAKEIRAYLKNKPYTRLGLYIGANSWDYPYYKYLSYSDGVHRTIKHVFVKNESSIYLDHYIPDAIISLEGRREKYTIDGIDYYQTVVFQDAMVLFEPK